MKEGGASAGPLGEKSQRCAGSTGQLAALFPGFRWVPDRGTAPGHGSAPRIGGGGGCKGPVGGRCNARKWLYPFEKPLFPLAI